MEDKICRICNEAHLTKDNAEYCGRCSPIYWHLYSQKRFEGESKEYIEAAAREKRKEKGRSNCGRKPSFVKIRTSLPTEATAC